MSDSDDSSDPSDPSDPSDSNSVDDLQEGQSNPSESETTNDSSSEEENGQGQSNSSESETPTDSPSEEENRQSGSSSPEPETSSDTFADVKDGVDLLWNSMVIGGLNVNSLLGGNDGKGKKASVKYLISEHDLDILVIGESKLKKDTTPINQRSDPLYIDKFTYVRQDRDLINKHASGGLIVYIREGIEYNTKSDWEWLKNNVQFLEIAITYPTRFVLVAIYSPDKEHAKYVIYLMRFFLVRNKVLNTPVMFVGDLNIDPERKVDQQAKQEFEQFSKEFSTRLLITDPTNTGGHCIDHIITNIPEELMIPVTPNVVKTIDIIADHNLVLCRVKHHGVQSISQLKRLPDKLSLLPIVSEYLVDVGKTKCVLTMFLKFDKPITTVDIKLPSKVQDTQYQSVRVNNPEMACANTIGTPKVMTQYKWLHSRISEDGKDVIVCVEFDSTGTVKERRKAMEKFIKELQADNRQWTNMSNWFTLVMLHKKAISQDMHKRDFPDFFLLTCTPEQLTSGDIALHGLLRAFSLKEYNISKDL